jgi:hypothetical protein
VPAKGSGPRRATTDQKGSLPENARAELPNTAEGPEGERLRARQATEGAEARGNGLLKLALSLVALLHDLLARQAVRRWDAGTLSGPEIESIGAALAGQAEELERLAAQFGFAREELDLRLGDLFAESP